MEEIIERQLFIRTRAFTAFSTIEEALAGRKKSFRGPYVVQTWHKGSLNHLGAAPPKWNMKHYKSVEILKNFQNVKPLS